MKETNDPFFIETIPYFDLVELAEVCLEQRTIGLSFGKPGVGKTTAAKRLANWSLVEANFAVRNAGPVDPEALVKCHTLYYLASITVSAPRLRSELAMLRNKFEDVFGKAVSWNRVEDWAVEIQRPCAINNRGEAHRLKYQALEELRDLHDKFKVGILSHW
ncbi:MAG: ATP-binding protein [Candidatus Obscuribacter sp.]|nr:ATP-binding protein [Candidatus Obscuribacter sp.]